VAFIYPVSSIETFAKARKVVSSMLFTQFFSLFNYNVIVFIIFARLLVDSRGF